MSNFNSVDTYLEHFGKKGMQWGVRNRSAYRTQSGKSAATIVRSSKNSVSKSNNNPVIINRQAALSVAKGALAGVLIAKTANIGLNSVGKYGRYSYVKLGAAGTIIASGALYMKNRSNKNKEK